MTKLLCRQQWANRLMKLKSKNMGICGLTNTPTIISKLKSSHWICKTLYPFKLALKNMLSYSYPSPSHDTNMSLTPSLYVRQVPWRITTRRWARRCLHHRWSTGATPLHLSPPRITITPRITLRLWWVSTWCRKWGCLWLMLGTGMGNKGSCGFCLPPSPLIVTRKDCKCYCVVR